jgi:hypothetical protein
VTHLARSKIRASKVSVSHAMPPLLDAARRKLLRSENRCEYGILDHSQKMASVSVDSGRRRYRALPLCVTATARLTTHSLISARRSPSKGKASAASPRFVPLDGFVLLAALGVLAMTIPWGCNLL